MAEADGGGRDEDRGARPEPPGDGVDCHGTTQRGAHHHVWLEGLEGAGWCGVGVWGVGIWERVGEEAIAQLEGRFGGWKDRGIGSHVKMGMERGRLLRIDVGEGKAAAKTMPA